ncbi:hypothetical protein J6590_051716 [Homalodisca vitripennis]|nr:hypothetical protein J6590_051716 [Homalodisca vitripennis]
MPPVARLPSSSYWIPPSRRPSGMNSTATSSTTDSADSTPRNYVDPWDLENYAYLRRHCADLEDSDPVVSLSTNGLDSAHSDFYFVPARQPLTPLPPPQSTAGVFALSSGQILIVSSSRRIGTVSSYSIIKAEICGEVLLSQRLERLTKPAGHLTSQITLLTRFQ